jgi:hypothetical protein
LFASQKVIAQTPFGRVPAYCQPEDLLEGDGAYDPLKSRTCVAGLRLALPAFTKQNGGFSWQPLNDILSNAMQMATGTKRETWWSTDATSTDPASGVERATFIYNIR